MNSTDIRQDLRTHGLDAHEAWILGRSTSALALRVEPSDDLPVGRTRAGGDADLPADFPWPCDEDEEPLAFLAQLALAELPSTALGLPSEGLLAFFIGASDDRFDVVCHVELVAPGELERTEVPDPEALEMLDLDGLNPCALHPTPCRLLRGADLDAFEQAGLGGWDRIHDLARAWYDQDALLLGGLADDVDHDPLEEVAKQAGGQPEDWQLLLRVPSNNDLATMFWDAYAAGFFIRKEDLAANRFDRVHCMLLRD